MAAATENKIDGINDSTFGFSPNFSSDKIKETTYFEQKPII